MSSIFHPLIITFQSRCKLRRFLVALVLVCGLGLSGREAWAQVQEEERIAPKQVDQLPRYPGGIAKALQFIGQHIHYPNGATKAGRVFVTFNVMQTGQLNNVRVVKGLEPLLDAEALRVVRLMPPWIPAKRDGKPVESSYMLPVTFVAAGTHAPPKKGMK